MKGFLPLVILWLGLVSGGMELAFLSRSFAPPRARDRGDVMLDAFGEFRTVMARYLWFKMDLFHEVLDDQGVHQDRQTELMPLLRMISLLDPNMTDAYDNIAWDLHRGYHQSKQAIGIIDEGLERNPNSYQLNFRRSLICYQDKQFAQAQISAEKAVSLADGAIESLNANRMLYWASKEVRDKNAMLRALDVLGTLRPEDEIWKTERAKVE